MKSQIQEGEIEAIKLFNEKVEEISNSDFIKKVVKTGFSFKKNGEFLESEIRGPNNQEIKAMLIDLRFLIQNNEPSSLRNLSKIYPTLNISKELKENFKNAREATNKYLDSASPMTINGKNLSNRYIFKVFIYGGFVHSNEKKIFDQWKLNNLLYPFLITDFFQILKLLLHNFLYIQDVNTQAIKELKKNESSTD